MNRALKRALTRCRVSLVGEGGVLLMCDHLSASMRHACAEGSETVSKEDDKSN